MERVDNDSDAIISVTAGGDVGTKLSRFSDGSVMGLILSCVVSREPTQRTQWEHHGMNGTPGGGGVRRPPPGGGGGGNYEEHYDRPTVGDHHYRPEGMVEQTRSAADHSNDSFYR